MRQDQPCLRCKDDEPLTATPRDELYFYTAGVNLVGDSFKTDTDRHPRGRLCAACTRAFAEWLG